METLVWTAKSTNAKTGPIPVTTTSANTCPTACPLSNGACYAMNGGMSHMWRAISAAEPGQTVKNGAGNVKTISWGTLVQNVAALPKGQLWRHNQAGDLPHMVADTVQIDRDKLDALVDANAGAGANGFTYSHHELTAHNLAAIADANARGFTINLSANSLPHADTLVVHGLPIATVMPIVYQRTADKAGNWTETLPAYRGRIAALPQTDNARTVVCPATYRDDVTCKSCGLCARADRKVIVGFPAHGAGKGKVAA